MNANNTPIDLIVHNDASSSKSMGQPAYQKELDALGIKTEIEPLPSIKKPTTKSKGRAPAGAGLQKTIVKSSASEWEINPWDLAHIANKKIPSNQSIVEPDLLQRVTIGEKERPVTKGKSSNPDDFDPDWPPFQNSIWHLDDKYSQLKSAREAVTKLNSHVIRIGHLDTGYGIKQLKLFPTLNMSLQRNFVETNEANDAHDRNVGGKLNMPGHGTGTLGILAGSRYRTPDGKFDDLLGGAPFAEVVACRISNTVALLKTSQFAHAINYLISLEASGNPVHVVTMSMGGLPAQIWADAVNDAYEAGITIVTAAGNNFNGVPTRKLIYPARFGRVTAACGVTQEYSPYYNSKLLEMQGNWGPERHMVKALAAFTPNIPWASMNRGTVSYSGAGTSSATPQIASAAACYYKKYYKELQSLPENWMRVEAIRNALYTSALKMVKKAREPYQVYFGNGILQAKDALNIPVPSVAELRKMKTPVDDVPFFPLFTVIFKAGPGRQSINQGEQKMFNIETMQLVQKHADLRKILKDEEKSFSELSRKDKQEFVDALIEKPDASKALRKFLTERNKDLIASAKPETKGRRR